MAIGSQQNTTAPAIAQLVRHSAPIDVLDDDSLLNVFRLYRPPLVDGNEGYDDRVMLGSQWNRERWWYKLTHVCRRWRHLILGSASSLGLCLLCAPGTPVADMLAHSPPFPIIIDHLRHDVNNRMTANDVEGIILALKHRDRVRRIRFRTPFPSMTEKIMVPMNGEFPMLEYLCISPMHLMGFLFPSTLQAPQLRYLILINLICPIGSPLLSAAKNLVALSLVNITPSTYFQPDELRHRVSLIPQLESLWITFDSVFSGQYADLDITHIHNATQISLLNLRHYHFGGFNAYSEALLSRITAPHLGEVSITFWEERPLSVSCLVEFMSTSEDLRLGSAALSFNGGGARLMAYPNEKARVCVFYMIIVSGPGRKVSNAAHVLTALSPLLSSVVHLTLNYTDSRSLPELQNEADLTDWRVLLRSFHNVTVLFVMEGAVGKLSRSLPLDGGESSSDFLPELKEIMYPPGDDNADAFDGFIDARQNAGHPVTLIHQHDSDLSD